ncbi:MAG: hypothetical protein ACRENG_20880 [bacterium]
MNKYLVCAWCNADINERTFSVGLRMLPSLDLSAQEGSFIPLPIPAVEKTVLAYVTQKGSEVKKAGFDVVVIACSESCRRKLQTALQNEKDAAGFMNMN